MARNRKNGSSVGFAPALVALLICGGFAASGIGYVWYKHQVDLLGAQLKEQEVKLAGLERDNKIRHDQLGAMCLPGVLDARIKKLNLGLGQALLTQMVHLPEPAGEPVAPPPAPPLEVQRPARAGL